MRLKDNSEDALHCRRHRQIISRSIYTTNHDEELLFKRCSQHMTGLDSVLEKTCATTQKNVKSHVF